MPPSKGINLQIQRAVSSTYGVVAYRTQRGSIKMQINADFVEELYGVIKLSNIYHEEYRDKKIVIVFDMGQHTLPATCAGLEQDTHDMSDTIEQRPDAVVNHGLPRLSEQGFPSAIEQDDVVERELPHAVEQGLPREDERVDVVKRGLPHAVEQGLPREDDADVVSRCPSTAGLVERGLPSSASTDSIRPVRRRGRRQPRRPRAPPCESDVSGSEVISVLEGDGADTTPRMHDVEVARPPCDASEIIRLPGLSWKHFLHDLKHGEIEQVFGSSLDFGSPYTSRRASGGILFPRCCSLDQSDVDQTTSAPSSGASNRPKLLAVAALVTATVRFPIIASTSFGGWDHWATAGNRERCCSRMFRTAWRHMREPVHGARLHVAPSLLALGFRKGGGAYNALPSIGSGSRYTIPATARTSEAIVGETTRPISVPGELTDLDSQAPRGEARVLLLALHQFLLERFRPLRVPTIHERRPRSVHRLLGDAAPRSVRLAPRCTPAAEQSPHLVVAKSVVEPTAVRERPPLENLFIGAEVVVSRVPGHVYCCFGSFDCEAHQAVLGRHCIFNLM
ncbi:hypothetical protein P3T76_013895 [Phytophthora citrophthora]|uniref:Uncharacterized protein n=1 Tax=Phytophthora citrophthora TaxID=4793 RepID=A0AAD9G2A5_9STRA|nr:hypothetical protein P3T76_013895 [Phytophthora citrophthora]